MKRFLHGCSCAWHFFRPQYPSTTGSTWSRSSILRNSAPTSSAVTSSCSSSEAGSEHSNRERPCKFTLVGDYFFTCTCTCVNLENLVHAQIGVRNADGTPFRRSKATSVFLDVVTSSASTTRSNRIERTVPDDGIVRVQIDTSDLDDVIRVHVSRTSHESDKRITCTVYKEKRPPQANMEGSANSDAHLVAFRHRTRTGHYLHVTSSTHRPTVNTYMVFTLRASTFVSSVTYLVHLRLLPRNTCMKHRSWRLLR